MSFLFLAALLLLCPPSAHSGRVMQQQPQQQQTLAVAMKAKYSNATSLSAYKSDSRRSQASSSAQLLDSNTNYCSLALSTGKPRLIMDKIISIGHQASSSIPESIRAAANDLRSITSFITDNFTPGFSIYTSCISGLPEASFNVSLDSAEIKTINHWVDIIRADIGDFINLAVNAPPIMAQEYQNGE